MRKLLEQQILIRLTETGFVETERYLGFVTIPQEWNAEEAEWLIPVRTAESPPPPQR
jgi:hypothetical protein